ncbi:MAG: hypothetical protein KJN68_03970, partial [Bacteroidia bacterium]|nr:hypothetical protein [Bacteroidia bacterium]
MSAAKKNQQETPTKQTVAEKTFLRYDDYWLEKAREMIDSSVETFSKRLKTLNIFLNFLAGGAFIGSTTILTYLQSTNLAVFIFALIPLIFIAIAKYFVSVGGTEPAMETADMRSPTQINKNYGEIIVTLSDQVKYAAKWVGWATAFTLVAFPFAIYFHNLEKATPTPETYLSIQNDGTNLSLQGVLQDAEKVSL